LKNYECSQSYAKKSNFDPPFWMDPPFLASLTKYDFESVAGQNKNLLQKTERKNVDKFLSVSELWSKIFFSAILKIAAILKTCEMNLLILS
jgi:hypothetical protein